MKKEKAIVAVGGILIGTLAMAEFDPATVEPGTVFTRKGLNNCTTIVYDPVTGALQMDTLTGLRIIFR